MREKRDLLIKVTRAVARGQRIAHTDPAATVAALKASAAAAVDPRQVEAIAAIYADAVPVNPRISVDGIRRAATLYPAHPRHPDFAVVDPADFVAADIAEAALKTL